MQTRGYGFVYNTYMQMCGYGLVYKAERVMAEFMQRP